MSAQITGISINVTRNPDTGTWDWSSQAGYVTQVGEHYSGKHGELHTGYAADAKLAGELALEAALQPPKPTRKPPKRAV